MNVIPSLVSLYIWIKHSNNKLTRLSKIQNNHLCNLYKSDIDEAIHILVKYRENYIKENMYGKADRDNQ